MGSGFQQGGGPERGVRVRRFPPLGGSIGVPRNPKIMRSKYRWSKTAEGVGGIGGCAGACTTVGGRGGDVLRWGAAGGIGGRRGGHSDCTTRWELCGGRVRRDKRWCKWGEISEAEWWGYSHDGCRGPAFVPPRAGLVEKSLSPSRPGTFRRLLRYPERSLLDTALAPTSLHWNDWATPFRPIARNLHTVCRVACTMARGLPDPYYAPRYWQGE